MVDLDSQSVRGLLSNLLTRFLSDTVMVNLDSQAVRGLLPNLLTRFLTPIWSIWTLSLCVVYSRIYRLNF